MLGPRSGRTGAASYPLIAFAVHGRPNLDRHRPSLVLENPWEIVGTEERRRQPRLPIGRPGLLGDMQIPMSNKDLLNLTELAGACSFKRSCPFEPRLSSSICSVDHVIGASTHLGPLRLLACVNDGYRYR